MEKIAKIKEMDTPKQDKASLLTALKVSERVQLENIRLMECNCKQLRLVGPGEKTFEMERNAKSTMDKATNRIFVYTEFTLKTFETESANTEPFAIFKTSFLLIYSAGTLDDITDEAVDTFGKTNGIFNAWPYWREFVQNTIVRMNLPSLTIPVFRIFAPKEPKPLKE